MALSKFSTAGRGLGLTAFAVLGTFSSSWVAAQDSSTGSYIGINAGQTRNRFNNDTVNRTLAGQGFNLLSTSEDNSNRGYKLFGGYQLNRNLAVEGGYFDLGRFNYALNTAPPGTFNSNTRVKGLNLDLVGMLPLTEQFSVFGRVGAAYAQNRTSFTNSGFLPLNNVNTSRNQTNPKVGLGLQYAISPALSLRGELERYRINDPIRNRGYIDMASLGLVYRFGGPVQTPVAQAVVPMVTPPPPPPPAPVMVAPAPPPPPPVVVAPAPPPPPPPAYEPPVRNPRQGRY